MTYDLLKPHNDCEIRASTTFDMIDRKMVRVLELCTFGKFENFMNFPTGEIISFAGDPETSDETLRERLVNQLYCPE